MVRLITIAGMLAMLSLTARAEERVLFDFDKPDSGQRWRVVNDGVMGGRSQGRFKINDEQQLEFFGNLSLANNGGFASIRVAAGKLAMQPGDAILIRVRGDGRQYNLNLYTQRNLGGYSYRLAFPTRKDEWITVRLPVDNFVATWRGRVFPDVRFDPRQVTGLGILLGDKKAGPFDLEVDWIKVQSPGE